MQSTKSGKNKKCSRVLFALGPLLDQYCTVSRVVEARSSRQVHCVAEQPVFLERELSRKREHCLLLSVQGKNYKVLTVFQIPPQGPGSQVRASLSCRYFVKSVLPVVVHGLACRKKKSFLGAKLEVSFVVVGILLIVIIVGFFLLCSQKPLLIFC